MKLTRLSIPAAAAALVVVIASAAVAQGPGRMMGDRGSGMWGADDIVLPMAGMAGPHWWRQ